MLINNIDYSNILKKINNLVDLLNKKDLTLNDYYIMRDEYHPYISKLVSDLNIKKLSKLWDNYISISMKTRIELSIIEIEKSGILNYI
jgi:hypothetical protein